MKVIGDERNLVKVEMGPEMIFQNNRTPFDTEAMAAICKDKEYSFELLHKRIAMPKTIGLFELYHQSEIPKIRKISVRAGYHRENRTGARLSRRNQT